MTLRQKVDSEQLLDNLLRAFPDRPDRSREFRSELPVSFSSSDKLEILLNVLNLHYEELNRKLEKEQKIFEWCTNLLLITLGAVIALSDRSTPLPHTIYIKFITTVFVLIPVVIFIYQIHDQVSGMEKNGEIIERIQGIIHVFDEGYYTVEALYPKKWSGKLPRRIRGRRTPIYYSFILSLMVIGVITTIWLVL